MYFTCTFNESTTRLRHTHAPLDMHPLQAPLDIHPRHSPSASTLFMMVLVLYFMIFATVVVVVLLLLLLVVLVVLLFFDTWLNQTICPRGSEPLCSRNSSIAATRRPSLFRAARIPVGRSRRGDSRRRFQARESVAPRSVQHARTHRWRDGLRPNSRVPPRAPRRRQRARRPAPGRPHLDVPP